MLLCLYVLIRAMVWHVNVLGKGVFLVTLFCQACFFTFGIFLFLSLRCSFIKFRLFHFLDFLSLYTYRFDRIDTNRLLCCRFAIPEVDFREA